MRVIDYLESKGITKLEACEALIVSDGIYGFNLYEVVSMLKRDMLDFKSKQIEKMETIIQERRILIETLLKM